MNSDADMYNVTTPQTSDELPPTGLTPYQERQRAELLHEVLTLIYRTVMDVDVRYQKKGAS